jgi:saccharopepsin
LDYNSPYYKRQKYNTSTSSSAVELASAASIPYLGGDVAGRIYQDTFGIPGADMT